MGFLIDRPDPDAREGIPGPMRAKNSEDAPEPYLPFDSVDATPAILARVCPLTSTSPLDNKLVSTSSFKESHSENYEVRLKNHTQVQGVAYSQEIRCNIAHQCIGSHAFDFRQS